MKTVREREMENEQKTHTKYIFTLKKMEKLFRTFKWHPNNARRCKTTPMYPIVVVHGVDGYGRLHRREKSFQHQQTMFAIRRQMTSLFHYINYLCVRIYPMVGQHDKLLSFSFVILILLYYNILSAHTFTHSCCTTLFSLRKLPWKGSAAEHTHTHTPSISSVRFFKRFRRHNDIECDGNRNEMFKI